MPLFMTSEEGLGLAAVRLRGEALEFGCQLRRDRGICF